MTRSFPCSVTRLSYMQITPPGPRWTLGILSSIAKASMSRYMNKQGGSHSHAAVKRDIGEPPSSYSWLSRLRHSLIRRWGTPEWCGNNPQSFLPYIPRPSFASSRIYCPRLCHFFLWLACQGCNDWTSRSWTILCLAWSSSSSSKSACHDWHETILAYLKPFEKVS